MPGPVELGAGVLIQRQDDGVVKLFIPLSHKKGAAIYMPPESFERLCDWAGKELLTAAVQQEGGPQSTGNEQETTTL